jgi:hypothetical protein
MKKSILAASILLMGVLATPAMAEEGRGSIGLGSYSLTIAPAIGVADTFSGTALVGSYDFTRLLSVSGHYYALKHEVFSAVKMDGYDLMLRAGKNDLGFAYFVALGLYSETMSASTSPLTFDYSGTLLGYGIGYNWEKVNVTLEGSIRSTGDYEGNTGNSYVAATGALNISYRF